MTPLRTLLILLITSLALGAGVAACGGGGGASDPTSTLVLQKGPVSGEGQMAAVATALPTPITVVVTLDGEPAAGVVVTFMPAPGSGAAVPSVDTTGVDGVASTQWTLGSGSGAQVLAVSAPGAGGSPQTFHATALAGAAASIAADSGDGQLQEPSLDFAVPIRVAVRDGFGNPVAGVSVSWGVVSGSGTVQGGSSLTNAAGKAVIGVSAGATPGPLSIRATTTQLPGDTALFALTVTPVASIVTIHSNFFQPATLTVASGSAVRWNWVSGTHNVAQLDGPATFKPAPVQDPGGTYGPLLFTTPGTYHYECSLHDGMFGSITVE